VTLIWACHKVYLNLTQFNVINLLVTGWQVFSMFPIFPPKLKYVMGRVRPSVYLNFTHFQLLRKYCMPCQKTYHSCSSRGPEEMWSLFEAIRNPRWLHLKYCYSTWKGGEGGEKGLQSLPTLCLSTESVSTDKSNCHLL
jgi:hypothetical protein